MTSQEARSLLPPFLAFVKTLDGDEKSEAQIFLDHLFRALGHGGAKEAGATFEYRVAKKPGTSQLSLFTDAELATMPKAKGGMKFADLLWPGRVVIEMKSRGEKLEKHYDQLFFYWSHIVPKRPPFAILCNFDELWIYDFNEQLFDPVERIRLVDLPKRYTALGFLFKHQVKPLFENNRVTVTRKAADHLAAVFRSLIVERPESQRIERARAQRFILQMLVGFVSEDLKLLPDDLVTRLLDDCLRKEANSYDVFGSLFHQMNNPVKADGGRFKGVPYFNGGLFTKVEPIDLRQSELERLRRAADQDWSQVRPEIFGTLFQHSMEADERHAYGAHFTSEVDINKVIEPTIARPWRERIEAAGKSRPRLRECLRDLRLYRVLDPACGSGNFLYMAYRVLKRLERDILLRLRDAGEPRDNLVSAVSPIQLFGMDVLPAAVEIARVTLTLAKELEVLEAEKLTEADGLELPESPLPLDNLDKQVQCADALFNPWPKADAIIGNPPYLGSRYVAQELGYDYSNKVNARFPGVPKMADFCTHWFRLAHDALPENGRAGLVGTNTIRQNETREASLDYIVEHGGTITEAVSTQVWSGEAQVHVSIVNWVKGASSGLKKLMTQKGDSDEGEWIIEDLPEILASLSSKTDVSDAGALLANREPKRCFQGQNPVNAGFFLLPEEAGMMIHKDPKLRDVIHPYMIGDDLVGHSMPTRWIIDFAKRDQFEARGYEAAFDWVKSNVMQKVLDRAEEEKVATGKEKTRWTRMAERWWQFRDYQPGVMSIIAKLPRYIACSRTTRRPIFEFVSTDVHPDTKLAVLTFADDYSFGIIQSLIHWEWVLARCSTWKADFNYTGDTVFYSFPWPQQPTKKQMRAVADAAVALRQLRRDTMKKLRWSLRQLYRTLEEPGTSPLRDAQAALDAAVRAAYGMDAKEDILAHLLALNHACAAKEKAGQPITPPGLPLPPREHAAFITSDCIRPPELADGGTDSSRAAAAHFHDVLREDPAAYGASAAGERP